jgi:hypothetical protein
MLNREQRRAQLKQLGKKFNGLDITKGTLDIPITGSENKITLDLMNFDTIYYLMELSEKFSDIQGTYSEDFDSIDKIEDNVKKSMALVRLYKKVIDDFAFYINKVFGEDATLKIFGNEAPMPQVIGEFIEDLAPVLQAVSAMVTSDANNTSVQSVLSSSINTKYSGDRLGNV